MIASFFASLKRRSDNYRGLSARRNAEEVLFRAKVPLEDQSSETSGEARDGSANRSSLGTMHPSRDAEASERTRGSSAMLSLRVVSRKCARSRATLIPLSFYSAKLPIRGEIRRGLLVEAIFNISRSEQTLEASGIQRRRTGARGEKEGGRDKASDRGEDRGVTALMEVMVNHARSREAAASRAFRIESRNSAALFDPTRFPRSRLARKRELD